MELLGKRRENRGLPRDASKPRSLALRGSDKNQLLGRKRRQRSNARCNDSLGNLLISLTLPGFGAQLMPRRFSAHTRASPIGHAGTTPTMTLDQLTAAFSTVRTTVERSRAIRGATSPATDLNAMTHDYNLFKLLLDSLTDLA